MRPTPATTAPAMPRDEPRKLKGPPPPTRTGWGRPGRARLGRGGAPPGPRGRGARRGGPGGGGGGGGRRGGGGGGGGGGGWGGGGGGRAGRRGRPAPGHAAVDIEIGRRAVARV